MARLKARLDGVTQDRMLHLQEQLTDKEVIPPSSEWDKFCSELQQTVQEALPGIYVKNFKYYPHRREFCFSVVASWFFKNTIFLSFTEEYAISLDLNLLSQLKEIAYSVKQLKKFGENIYKTANPHVPR